MYNFDEIIDRRHTASLKWDNLEQLFGDSDLLSMWVADMDFRPPKEVLDAMKERVEHGVFGYTIIEQDTIQSIQNWLLTQHGWEVQPDWLLFSPGVVPSIGMAVQAFTEVGDKVMLQSPVYTPFFNMIKTNGREVVNSELKLVNGRYEIDFEDVEEKLKSGIKLFLLCSPHNPGGRVWTQEELVQLAELCKKYNCIIASDEIHADLVYEPIKHIPIASLNEDYQDFIVTFMAPSKTFNLAGLQASYMIIPNRELRKKLSEVMKSQGVSQLNTFGVLAMKAAYDHGQQWLNEVKAYIKGNIDYVKEELEKHVPEIEVLVPDATYLIWIDCRKIGLSDKELRERLLKKGKIAVNFGYAYGPGGEGFFRLNVACPRKIVEEGIKRICKAFN